jgi:hypothetical protein
MALGEAMYQQPGDGGATQSDGRDEDVVEGEYEAA